jgi:hypothetical protein
LSQKLSATYYAHGGVPHSGHFPRRQVYHQHLTLNMKTSSKRFRNLHKKEVKSFLQRLFPTRSWEISLPPYGTGQETYFARCDRQSFFIKLGAEVERYHLMSDMGLSPSVVATGFLEDGTSILVQEKVIGEKPSRADFHRHLETFAGCIRKTHQCEALQNLLPKRTSHAYKDVGLEVLGEIEKRWNNIERNVPASAAFVNDKIFYLKDQLSQFDGCSLVASHNDVCNGNWLVSTEEKIYLLDYESMSLDDPALDLGAILWWYYPPEMRKKFIEIAGYTYDEAFRARMRIRMAVHCLNIIIPRQESFDPFIADRFEDWLVDFRAVIAGKENPQGYYD